MQVVFYSTGIGLGSYFCYLAMQFGVSGAIRYVWEGDYLTEDNRDALETLQNCEKKLHGILKKLEEVKCIIKYESLNSIGGEDNIAFPISGKLRKKAGTLSNDVDKISSKIDSVLTKGRVEEVASMKKKLSARIVVIADEVDVAMEFLLEIESNYTKLKEEAKIFYERDEN